LPAAQGVGEEVMEPLGNASGTGPETPAGTSRREFSRVGVRLEVVGVTVGGVRLAGTTRDLGLKSLFLVTDARGPPGTDCELCLLRGGPPAPLRLPVRGRVVRAEAAGLAIEFPELAWDSFQHLRQVVTYNAADVPAVEKELAEHLGLKRRPTPHAAT